MYFIQSWELDVDIVVAVVARGHTRALIIDATKCSSNRANDDTQHTKTMKGTQRDNTPHATDNQQRRTTERKIKTGRKGKAEEERRRKREKGKEKGNKGENREKNR